ncbi:MAG: hypothetical protein GC139_07260 [Sideroxydans sp.]|nr:hypothetical protein [Sideroxydans sp.]
MNLPISTNTPQVSAAPATSSAQAPDDQATAQAADPFGNVLARQLADKTSPATGTSLDSFTAIAEDKKSRLQAAATDGSTNTPPADMLAALLVGNATQATAKPDATATAGTHGKAALTDGKAALKLALAQPGQSAVPADKHGVAGKEQQFAAALHTLSDKAELSGQHKPAMPADAQPPAAALSQFAQANALPAAANPAKLSVDTPVNSKNWGGDFSQKITWLATQHAQSAELHLNPPNLGPLDVVLNVSGDQATAMFTSPHAAVRDAIEQAMPKLREMMADNGIMLGNATVSDQGQRDNHASQPHGQSRTAPGNDSGTITGIGGISQTTRTVQISRHNGLVDTFA